ncbi:hypothetical protein LCGC14_2353520, partial [marine sediment metagenome]
MAIALDTATTKTGAAASYTWAHTCTGADLILVVEIAWVASDAGRWINTVTYDGIALTKVAGLVSDRDRCELWYLIGPPTGSNNVVVTNAGAGGKTAEIAAGAVSYTGVHQTDPISGFVTQTGSGASITKDISSGADNLVVDIVAAHTNGVGVSFAPGGGQSEEWNVEFGTIIIEKQTNPAGFGGNFGFTGEITTGLAHGEFETKRVPPGTYTVTETGKAGWTLSGIDCKDNN